MLCRALAVRPFVVPRLRRPHPRQSRSAGPTGAPEWGSGGQGGVGAHGAVDAVGDSSFEAAQRFAAGLAFGAFALVVGAAFGVTADLGDRDRVQRAVELPVPAGVVAVSDGASGGRRQRCGAVGGGEGVAVG